MLLFHISFITLMQFVFYSLFNQERIWIYEWNKEYRVIKIIAGNFWTLMDSSSALITNLRLRMCKRILNIYGIWGAGTASSFKLYVNNPKKLDELTCTIFCKFFPFIHLSLTRLTICFLWNPSFPVASILYSQIQNN